MYIIVTHTGFHENRINNTMADEVKETLRAWLAIDDQMRTLQAQMKTLRDQKTTLGAQVLAYMKDNDLANFVLDGTGGTIARSERVSRPALKRSTLRQQLFLQFADQPERVAEALRAIEGIPEGGDDMSVGGTKRDILSRRLPRSQNISLN
jgi:hypothetical protein